jgi:hypothetical protein
LLKLRRGRVVSVQDSGAGERVARLTVELEGGGPSRAAIAYPPLTGAVGKGDDVVVNVEAQDLRLGSGGFDVVYANLTSGLSGEGCARARVMKLNYTPLQTAVAPVEEGLEQFPVRVDMAASVLPLHGYLAGAAFAFSQRAPGRLLGYIQTAGGALPGWLSDVVAQLLEQGLIAGHVSAAPCFGGAQEAITVEGALHAAATRLGWDGALVAPGPGMLGSASTLGHGGLEALHSSHAALALGVRPLLAPRLSSGDPRARHRGLSHHTRTVLSLLLRPVDVAVPDGMSEKTREQLLHAIEANGMHQPIACSVEDLGEPYLASGLPASTMGRSFEEDPDFFRAALAAGVALAEKIVAK